LPTQADDIINTFEDMINVVGTTAIVIATIVLGIRYIIGSVESKTSAKEGLITLLIACIFFFGWTSISNLLYGGSEYDFIFTSDTDNSYTSFVGRLFNTFTYIANVVVIGCIIYVGVKYILAGAEGRSELKGKSIYLIIGIILAFATTNVLTFISDVINETL
jgi:type IV secretory pathway VirB2 component (pilin)